MLQSCESTELEILDNPNSITPEQADENFVLNAIQASFGIMTTQTDLTLSRAMRYDHQFGAYGGDATYGINAQRTDDDWRRVYISNFQNVRIIETISQNKDIPFHLGVAHILEAYTLLMAVDQWGDIPYTEANLADDNGAASFNPNADDDEFLYDAALNLLNQAIGEINQVTTSTPPINDIFYGGIASNWIKLANSIKISTYLNLRLVRDVASDVNAIISNPANYISSSSDDFIFQYSTQNAAPDSRHTRFVNDYISLPGGYVGNWILNKMLNDSNGISPDPRMRYYFYRQTATDPSVQDNPCTGNPNYDFCYVGGFYRGRDHGDDLGIANDASRRTAIGLYPIGGKFDDNSFTGITQNDGAQGAGITPILTNAFIQFMLAELSLTESGVNGSSENYFSNAVQASFEAVRDFRPDLVTSGLEINSTNLNDYLLAVVGNYNSASNEDKMNLIADEFYIAAFGNAYHSFNLYRRTGFPKLQEAVTPPGPFPRLLSYPNSEVNGNSNISQRQVTDQVFWDNNSAGFIN